MDGEEGRGLRPPWPDVALLIPHRSPMLLVEEIVEVRERGLVCRGTLPSWGPPFEGFPASPFLTLELAAQTAAVLAALEIGQVPAPDPDIGYLAAIHDARFLVAAIPSGRRLLATVHRERRMLPLTQYSVTIALEEGAVDLVRATLSTYRASPPGRPSIA